jgi:hypothetical protein
MDLVELGARSMDLMDLEYLKLGCLAGKKWSGAVFLSEAAWSSPKHALRPCLGGLRLLGKKVEPELKPQELGFVAPPTPPPHRQSRSSPPHMLQYGAAPLSKRLVELQQEPP